MTMDVLGRNVQGVNTTLIVWRKHKTFAQPAALMTDEAVDIRLKELEALNDGKGD